MITKAYNLYKNVKRRKSGKVKDAMAGAVLDNELKRIIGEPVKKKAQSTPSTPSMIKEMRQKGKRRIQDAENKRRRKNWQKNASKEDKRLHEQNRLDQESAIERQNSYRKSYGDWLKD